MKGYSVHNVTTMKVSMKDNKSGKELVIFPGINKVSDEDFLVFGNQIRNKNSLKLVERIKNVLVPTPEEGSDEAPKMAPLPSNVNDDKAVEKLGNRRVVVEEEKVETKAEVKEEKPKK